jgi:hypothetical protein
MSHTCSASVLLWSRVDECRKALGSVLQNTDVPTYVKRFIPLAAWALGVWRYPELACAGGYRSVRRSSKTAATVLLGVPIADSLTNCGSLDAGASCDVCVIKETFG